MIEPYIGTEPFIGFIPDFVVDFINAGLSGALDLFTRLMEASGMIPLYISLVFVFLLGKFLLVPLFGRSSGSDQVKKRNNSGGSDHG